ncbi:hypothetical protein V8C35DRAFT_316279 [Trichoderma chlorosporum]
MGLFCRTWHLSLLFGTQGYARCYLITQSMFAVEYSSMTPKLNIDKMETQGSNSLASERLSKQACNTCNLLPKPAKSNSCILGAIWKPSTRAGSRPPSKIPAESGRWLRYHVVGTISSQSPIKTSSTHVYASLRHCGCREGHHQMHEMHLHVAPSIPSGLDQWDAP